MLTSQLAPYEIIYLDQKGNEVPVKRNEDRVGFQTFTELVEHLKTHPDFDIEGHTRVTVGFELAEGSKTVLYGVMGYRRDLNGNSLKVTTFKVRGDLPELRVPGWFIDFTQAQ